MEKVIALVEDDDTIRQNIAELLEENRFVVQAYASRAEAENAFSLKLPDMALLDIGLNEEREGGFDLCRFIRKRSETIPVIFLTSYSTNSDEISGLRLGADDYISKEEPLEKVIVRINSLFRRTEALSNNLLKDTTPNADYLLHSKELTIDMLHYEVTWKGYSLKFPLTQLWILHSLAKRPGQIKSKESLMEAANITHSGSSTIVVHINAIRNAFKSVDQSFDKIENKRGLGYLWKPQ